MHGGDKTSPKKPNGVSQSIDFNNLNGTKKG